MRDLVRSFIPLPDVMVFEFEGGRITAMNDAIIRELKTDAPTAPSAHGENILENRATDCLFDRTPLPAGLRNLKGRLYESLSIYLDTFHAALAGRPFLHRSWCNHYPPNQGVPWHRHARTPVVCLYSIKGNGGDLMIEDVNDPQLCHRIATPPGRLIFFPGRLRHCSTPNFGPTETRISLPVNFYFEQEPKQDVASR